MISANGISLAVYEEKPVGAIEAQKYPIILCHGFPELAYSWRHQFEPLVNLGFHVIAPDHRGYGRSDVLARQDDYPLSEILKDICGLLDYYQYEKAIFIGHDFGGTISWGMGHYHSDRVAGICVSNAPLSEMKMNPVDMYLKLYGPKNYFSFFHSQECEDKLNKDTARTFRFYMRRDLGLGTNLSRSRKRDVETISHLYWIYDEEESWPGECFLTEDELAYYSKAFSNTGFGPALYWYRCLSYEFERQRAEFPEGLPKISCPVMAIGSEYDYIAAYSFYEILDNYCDQHEKVLIMDASHWTQQEKPVEYNKAVSTWLKKHFVT